MALTDPFLCILVVVVTLLLIVGNIYILAYYSHPADKSF